MTEELKTIDDMPWSEMIKHDLKRIVIPWYYKLKEEETKTFILHVFKVTADDLKSNGKRNTEIIK